MSPVPPVSPVQLSGSWKLDAAASQVDPAAGLAGLIGAGAPPMLFITQPRNGTLVIESPINEGHARIFHPGGKTQTPAGQGGTISMTSQWAGNTLTGEGTVANASGAVAAVKEAYAISADGKVLTIEVTTTSPEAKNSSLKYVRIDSVGPCESWPTPCKR